MVTQRTWLAGTVVPGARVWTGPSHLARSRPKAEVSLLWLTELTPAPMVLCSPFLSRDRIWLGETEEIFCLDQLIFLSCALANQRPGAHRLVHGDCQESSTKPETRPRQRPGYRSLRK